jgi:hypothetical protein
MYWVCFNSLTSFAPQLGHWSSETAAWIVPWPGLVATCSLIVTGTLRAEHIRWTVNAVSPRLAAGACLALSHGLVLRAAPSWVAFGGMAAKAIAATIPSNLFMTTSFCVADGVVRLHLVLRQPLEDSLQE